jgi:hypothetical protein
VLFIVKVDIAVGLRCGPRKGMKLLTILYHHEGHEEHEVLYPKFNKISIFFVVFVNFVVKTFRHPTRYNLVLPLLPKNKIYYLHPKRPKAR